MVPPRRACTNHGSNANNNNSKDNDNIIICEPSERHKMRLHLPSFDELPPVEGMPQGCAWGVFDHDGEKDVFGTLNILNPDVVKAAAQEVQDGISISLKSVLSFSRCRAPLPRSEDANYYLI